MLTGIHGSATHNAQTVQPFALVGDDPGRRLAHAPFVRDQGLRQTSSNCLTTVKIADLLGVQLLR
jgi:hypothetical protein